MLVRNISSLTNILQQWEDNSGLTLNYVKPNQKSDIVLNFDRIDSKMNVLGQGYFPPIGRIIFDIAENWNFGGSGKESAKRGRYSNFCLNICN